MRFARVVAATAILFVTLPLSPASAATRGVTIPGRYFQPQRITIVVGDTVRWTNSSSERHTVTANSQSNESFNSSSNCRGALLFDDCIKPGQTFFHTFQARGTFTYHCELHGADAPFPNCGMCGRVTVVRKSTGTVAPTTPGTSQPTLPGSISPSASASGSPSPTVSSSSPVAGGPGDGGTDDGPPTLAITAAAVVLLGASGFLVYRTMIR